MSLYDENILSDLYKDVYGCRPRDGFWSRWADSSETEKQAIWDRLIVDLDYELEDDRQRQAAAIAQWRADIARNLAMGARTRRDAILWDLQAYGFDRKGTHDAGQYCYQRGIPYHYERQIERAMRAR